jgi:hypothetical protein
MLRVVAKHADIWDSSSSIAELRERGAEIDRHCRELGRDPGEIIRSVSMGADRLEDATGFAQLARDYRAAGADQLLFDFPLGGPGLDSAQRIAREIIPALREELGVGS